MGRVDDKDVTLTLNKQTVKLYFTTVLGRGKFDRDGRDKMRDKYYLDPHVFDKFSPPDLWISGWVGFFWSQYKASGYPL